ncbi:neuroplastin-like isoform X7 [Panulirus ornatus]|uniref:neuroplastin-like isoform X7 n=1 Tax=Panulirus ornatus TaxID=150431 RepID=UPI003A8BB645
MCCTTEAKMKSTGTLIFLGLLGICLGQGFGGLQAGGDVVWTDDYALDDMGSSPIIVTSGMGQPDPFYRGYQTTTPAPQWGIGGGAHGSETEVEADVLGSESVQVLFVGFPLKLSCNMTYNESIYTKVKWFKDNEELESNDHIKLFVVNSSLVIMKPGKEDAGDYRCETLIEVSEDKPHVKSFKVIYFEIRKMDKSTNIDKGEDLVLECPVEGSPYPTIQWKKDDVPIYDAINGTRLTPKPNEKNVPNATLIISKAEWIDRGNFTCTITTLSNTFERFTYVRVKDVYAALWPFLGIVIEVLLLGIIIFIFEKRRAKAEFEESDTDQGNDQKNTADHNKDSVRQRK